MEKQKYAKIIKVLLWVLLILSVGVLILGSVKGFEANDGKMTDLLLYWGYAMIGLALVCVICVGLYIAIRTNPKSLVKLGIILVGAAVLAFIAYLLASGKPAMGYNGTRIPTASELKMTDTILNLAYILGGAAIASIIVGEIVMSLRNKKA